MLLRQIKLLVGLSWSQVKAASDIIDHGQLWFAVAVAGLALVWMRAVARLGVVYIADPTIVIKILAALAFGFVPGIVLVVTIWRSHESFGVMLRKDFSPLLTCVLMSFGAVYLPFAALSTVARAWLPYTWFQPLFGSIAGLIALVAFAALAACCTRTLWGTGYFVAAASVVAGFGAAVGALIASVVLGRFVYYLASPMLIYYAWIFLGSDVRSLGGGLRSRQHFRRQLDIAASNPKDADAQYQLGLVYQERRQYDEARKRYLRAIEIDPREADPFFQLGKIALDEGRAEEAIGFLNSAAALDDKCCSHEVWRELGRAYLKASRLEEARAALGKYVERRPYDPEGLYYQGEALLAAGCSAEAKQAFSECKAAVDTMPPQRRRQVSRWGRMASSALRGIVSGQQTA
jgi:tetratricopeptide (TPR) repeat protein